MFLKCGAIIITRKEEKQVLLADQTFGQIHANGLEGGRAGGGGSKERIQLYKNKLDSGAAKRRAVSQGTRESPSSEPADPRGGHGSQCHHWV